MLVETLGVCRFRRLPLLLVVLLKLPVPIGRLPSLLPRPGSPLNRPLCKGDEKASFGPPASHFIREAAKLQSGSKEPGRVIAGSITMKQAEAIAKENNLFAALITTQKNNIFVPVRARK